MAPRLDFANEEIWLLWTFAKTQFRASAFGLVGLDYPAVFKLAEVLGVEIDHHALQCLKALEARVLEEGSKGPKSE